MTRCEHIIWLAVNRMARCDFLGFWVLRVMGLVGVCDAESIWTMPVVTVLDSFLKMIILVENYRLRFKISGSGPAGTLDSPFTTRFRRLVRFWTDTLCSPGVTLGHVTASMARLCHTCVLLCGCVPLCTDVLCCCVLLCWCVLYCCVDVYLCVFTGSCPLFW